MSDENNNYPKKNENNRGYGQKTDRSANHKPQSSFNKDSRPQRTEGGFNKDSRPQRTEGGFNRDSRPQRTEGGFNKDSRPQRTEGGFNRDSRPQRTEGGFNRDSRPQRTEGGFNRDSRPQRTEGGFNRDSRPQRTEGGFNRDSRPQRTEGGFNRDSRPQRTEGGFNRDSRPQRTEGGFNRDSRPQRTEGGFNRDSRPQRTEGGFNRDSRPQRTEGGFNRDSRPQRTEGGFNRDSRPQRTEGGFNRDSRPQRTEGGFNRDSRPQRTEGGFSRDSRPQNRYDKKPFSKGNSFHKKDNRPFINDQNQDDEFSNLQLEGRNAVLEALNNDKEIDKLFIKKSEAGSIEGTLKVIQAKAKEKGVVVIEASKSKLDSMAHSENHQGVIAFCPAIDYSELDDMIALAKSKNEDPFIVILDSITDPHNLGAIIRSAEASGAHGIIIPKRRATGISGIVSKTSAGALQHILISKVANLNTVIEELKAAGVWIACADMEGKDFYTEPLKGPIALVIGSEGEGVARLVKENSDYVVKIPMYGKIDSLNASVAAGILMYEVVRQRKFQ